MATIGRDTIATEIIQALAETSPILEIDTTIDLEDLQAGDTIAILYDHTVTLAYRVLERKKQQIILQLREPYG